MEMLNNGSILLTISLLNSAKTIIINYLWLQMARMEINVKFYQLLMIIKSNVSPQRRDE